LAVVGGKKEGRQGMDISSNGIHRRKSDGNRKLNPESGGAEIQDLRLTQTIDLVW